ncbi:hypothetical protein STEG23_037887 [Scotinomys teguina]
MARKAGQGKEEEESRARQQEEKTPVREEEKTPACDGRGHHVVEQGENGKCQLCDEHGENEQGFRGFRMQQLWYGHSLQKRAQI